MKIELQKSGFKNSHMYDNKNKINKYSRISNLRTNKATNTITLSYKVMDLFVQYAP